MILASAVVIGLVASLIRYRRHTVDQLAAIPLHWMWLALLALALQWPLIRARGGDPRQVVVQQALFLLSHLLLLGFVWRNRHLSGIRIVGLGVLCNLVVVALNGGFMPVAPETLLQIHPGSALEHWSVGLHVGYSKDLVLSQASTRLWVLSDILILPPPFPWPTAFSVGDLIIAMGVVVLLASSGPVLRTADAESGV
jgi:hypothetical protein